MRSLTITQIGSVDEGGGAAAVARGLRRAYADRGHRVRAVVGRKVGQDGDVFRLRDDDRWPFRALGYTAAQDALGRLSGRFPGRGFGRASRSLRLATHPQAVRAQLRGEEDFEFPATASLLRRFSSDVVHAHNLHGGYFDLRELPAISRGVPTVVTLHDMWMLSGHCAHALDCERWRKGCGSCPHLDSYPAVRRDATAANWRRKQQIFEASRLHVAVPSRWLRDKVEASMVMPGVAGLRVIPNGVDTRMFRPGSRVDARAQLGMPEDAEVVMLTADATASMWKDRELQQHIVQRLRGTPRHRAIVFANPNGAADQRTMVTYYQAADVYLHVAKADTFPLAVLEAMACGTPVVASAVGGIPEQVDDGCGILFAQGDADAAAAAVARLLSDGERRSGMSTAAVTRVNEHFTLSRQVDAYLDWYQEILQ